jgi:hypothetical protein
MLLGTPDGAPPLVVVACIAKGIEETSLNRLKQRMSSSSEVRFLFLGLEGPNDSISGDPMAVA